MNVNEDDLELIFAPWRLGWVSRDDTGGVTGTCVFCAFFGSDDDRENRTWPGARTNCRATTACRKVTARTAAVTWRFMCISVDICR
jgi:hypothetical protein